MIPTFDSFDYFSNLFPLLVVLIPLAVVVRVGALRRAIFVVAGVYLLFLIAPRLALFHLAFWLITALLQPLVAATGERRHGAVVLWGSIVAVMAPMVAWKVWPVEFVIEFNVRGNQVFRATNDFLEALDFSAPIVTAIGLSFSSFRAADLMIKSNLGLVDRLTPGRTLAYGLFPPLLAVGPIASYDETATTLEAAVPVDRDRALRGMLQILSGLGKVFVLAYLLSWSADIFVFFPINPTWRVWASLIAFAWYFYLNFAGYSDMAIGSGRLLGGNIRPNFDWPYTRTNPSAFWNSWHISLTRFLRMNVFTPLVGRHPERQYAAAMLIMLMIGLWHAVTWASVVFGLYHGVSLVAHRMLERRRPPSDAMMWRVSKAVFVFFWFALSLPLLRLSLAEAIDFYAALLGVAR